MSPVQELAFLSFNGLTFRRCHRQGGWRARLIRNNTPVLSLILHCHVHNLQNSEVFNNCNPEQAHQQHKMNNYTSLISAKNSNENESYCNHDMHYDMLTLYNS